MERVNNVCDKLLEMFKMSEKQLKTDNETNKENDDFSGINLDQSKIPKPLKDAFVIYIFICMNLSWVLWDLQDIGLTMRILFIVGSVLLGGWLRQSTDQVVKPYVKKISDQFKDNFETRKENSKVKQENDILIQNNSNLKNTLSNLVNYLTAFSTGDTEKLVKNNIRRCKWKLFQKVEKKMNDSELSIS